MHEELVRWINGDRPIKVSDQDNGTIQLRLARRPFKRFLEVLGVRSVTGEHKTVPWAIEQAPPEIVAAFLRGLFDADGCAVLSQSKGSYVGLGSISIELLRGVQRLLSTFGIASRIYGSNPGGVVCVFVRAQGRHVDSVSPEGFLRPAHRRIIGRHVRSGHRIRLVSQGQRPQRGVRPSTARAVRNRHDDPPRRAHRRRHRTHLQPHRAA